MPEAAPVMRAELPALKTGCKGMLRKWAQFNRLGVWVGGVDCFKFS